MGVCFEQKTFLLAYSIFQVFSSRSLNAFVEWDKTKFTKSFLPAFFYSLAIAKMHPNWIIYCFSCFVYFVVHCFVYYVRLFFLFWIFTIGIYTLFCLRATYFLQIWMTLTKHQNLNIKNLLKKMLSRIFGWSLLTPSTF